MSAPGEPLDVIYRRIVRAHAALAEMVGEPERRGFVLRELMETLHYIDQQRGRAPSP